MRTWSDNYKPTAQAESLLLLAAGLGVLVDGTGPLDGIDPVNGIDQKMNYVNFYAFLQKVVDKQIGVVVDALEENPALYKKTVVIRVSDHGEMGLSHGGLRQKLFNAYEETLHIPIVISNPDWFPQAVQTDALASLIDIMPTLATLAKVPNPERGRSKGVTLRRSLRMRSNIPITLRPRSRITSCLCYDDDNPGSPNPQDFVHEPCHIRAIRDTRYKYTVYFDPCGKKQPQHELYDLLNDSQELHNMANPLNTAYYNPDAGRPDARQAAGENGRDGRHLHALDAVLSNNLDVARPCRSARFRPPDLMNADAGSAKGRRAAGIPCSAEAPRRDLQPGLQVLLLPLQGTPVSGQPLPHVRCAAGGLYPAAHRGP